MNPDFPTRTENTLTLSNGDAVIVRILNELQRDSAEKKAHRIALGECLSLAKGGVEYPALQAQIKQMSADAQAKFLAQMDYPRIANDAATAFPLPNEPEKGDKEPAEYARAFALWEQQTAAAKASQAAQTEAQYAEAVAKYLAVKPRERGRLCEEAYFAQEFSVAYGKAYVLELLHRAVRQSDNLLERYYPSADAVEDAPDADREALWQCYMQMELSPQEIPTLPAE